MRITLLAFFVFLIPNLLFGQYGETIRTLRPGRTFGAFALGKNVLQLQTGMTLNWIDDGTNKIYRHSETTIVRYGLFERLELSGVVQWRTRNRYVEGTEVRENGISNTQIGARINLFEGKGAIPVLGLQGRVLLNAQAEPFQRERLGSRFVLATGNKLTNWLGLRTNWGITWSGNGGDPRPTYSAIFVAKSGKKTGLTTEFYGFLDTPDLNTGLGFFYLINKDFQLDVSTGARVDTEVLNWYLDFGISIRTDWRDREN
ncbi:MAG: transporter [Bacteroidota bacterium]